MESTDRYTGPFTAPRCSCGQFLTPELMNVTMPYEDPTWLVSWRCEFEFRHDWVKQLVDTMRDDK